MQNRVPAQLEVVVVMVVMFSADSHDDDDDCCVVMQRSDSCHCFYSTHSLFYNQGSISRVQY